MEYMMLEPLQTVKGCAVGGAGGVRPLLPGGLGYILINFI
jgi:hypothetical protein